MDTENLLARSSGERSEKNIKTPDFIYDRESEKMTAEIADEFRIRIIDAPAFKNSYTAWADQWK